jgi:DNA-binding winged helix-turn-helix (wHTH) protein/tetratricopeptide (TPR) repeat protein
MAGNVAERAAAATYEFGPFRLDARERRLLRNGKPVALTPKAFETLLVLVTRRDHVVGKDDLLKTIWPNALVDESSLARNISVLRKALQDTSHTPRFIETVPRRGYRFVGAVSESMEPDCATRAGAPPTVAVLPFTPVAPEQVESFLGLGFADSLITRLSWLKRLIVRPTNAVRKYAVRHDPVSAGRALGVQWVVDGCMRVSGNRLRVTVQLVNVRNGATAWAEKFDIDGSLNDIFRIEDAIAERVASVLAHRLSALDRSRLSKRHTDNPEAHRLYLTGRYHWNKRTEESLRQALDCFTRALAADPGYALAYAGMADAYMLLGSYSYGTVHPRDVTPLARAAAARALEIDEELAEPTASLAFIKFRYDWDWTEADRLFRRATELDPYYATARQWYAFFLAIQERHDAALLEIRRAQELDPLSLPIATGVGRLLYFAGGYAEAIDACRRAIALDSAFAGAHLDLGMVYEQVNQYDEAIAEFHQALRLSGGSPLVLVQLGHAYGMSGRTVEARRVLNQLVEISTRLYVAPFDWAIIHIGLGETEKALERLDEAWHERSSSLVFLKAEHSFAPLYGQRRFQALLRRIGLAGFPDAD